MMRGPGAMQLLLLLLAAAGTPARAARQLRSKSTPGEVVLPWAFFDGNASDIAARAAEAEALSAQLMAAAPSPKETVGLSSNHSGELSNKGSHTASTSAVQQAANNSDSKGGKPRIFFLFMAYRSISHMDLWTAFFQQAEKGRWRALVHCKEEQECRHRLSLTNPFGVQVVESAPSSYCRDLVSPMVQLLRVATKESTHPNDKFVFLSDTTLPVKPFAFIHSELTRNTDSDICIEPRYEWVWLDNKPGAAIVKHSQWVVLSVGHSRTLVQRWPHIIGSIHNAEWSVPVWPASAGPGYTASDFGSAPHHGLCADEWAVFAALFGVVISPRVSEAVPGLSTPTLNITGPPDLEGQGVCRTFVTWGESTVRESSRVAAKMWNLLSCYPHCLTSHPAYFARMTDAGLRVLRSSSFLFARKFPSGIVTKDQFVRELLAPAAPNLSAAASQAR